MTLESYNDHIARLRQAQFPALATQCYLDAAGTPPTPVAIHDAVHQCMTRGVGAALSNPHSGSPSGSNTARLISEVRSQVARQIFNVSPQDADGEGWDLVFTSGATASLQLAATSFDFGSAGLGHLGCSKQSHTSLLGLRDIVPGHEMLDIYDGPAVLRWVRQQYQSLAPTDDHALLALPMQCNATGQRFDALLSDILVARRELEAGSGGKRRVYLLLDAASYLTAATRLDLHRMDPDFVAFSFYKILGHPTGLGGLFVRRQSALDRLLGPGGKRYYGGGTLDAIVADENWRQPVARTVHRALEDGTPNVHGIIAAKCALDALASSELLGSDWKQRQQHVKDLVQYLETSLDGLYHHDGTQLCRLYTTLTSTLPSNTSRGPIVLFNVTQPNVSAKPSSSTSQLVDPAEVERLASVSGIHLRTGRMCNVGAISFALQLKAADIKELWTQGIGCGSGTFLAADDREGHAASDSYAHIISSAIRVSLCVWNTRADVDRLVAFLRKFFLDSAAAPAKQQIARSSVETACKRSPSQEGITLASSGHVLESIHIYPIKSCAAQHLRPGEMWKVQRSGLEHDRRFCIVDLLSGKVMSQKRSPRMATVCPTIDRDNNVMTVRFSAGKQSTLTVRLDRDSWAKCPASLDIASARERLAKLDMCGRPINAVLHPCSVLQATLSEYLGHPCTLGRFDERTDDQRQSKDPILFSNESAFLAISRESVQQVCRWIHEDGSRRTKDDRRITADDFERVAMAFRANFVVASRSTEDQDDPSFWEDSASHLIIGNSAFNVLGPCRRCEMIGLDQRTGSKAPEVFSAIARHRRCRDTGNAALQSYRGRLLFGIHLDLSSTSDAYVTAGMPIVLS